MSLGSAKCLWGTEGTYLHALRAPGMEATSRRRMNGAWRVALEDNARGLPCRVRDRYGGKKHLGIRMEGIRKEFLGWCNLHNSPKVHDGNPVGNVAHHAEVMGDEEVREVHLFLELTEEVENLCPHRNIKGRDRLVAHHEVRFKDERPGDTDTLPLPSGELVRVIPEEFRLKANLQRHHFHSFPANTGIPFPVDDKRFFKNGEHRFPGIECSKGVLENNLHAPAVRLKIPKREGENIYSLKER